MDRISSSSSRNAVIQAPAPKGKMEDKFSIIQRGSDILTVVEIDALSDSANEINAEAIKQAGMPLHKPDGAGAILIFHTEQGNFVLGGLRSNPALEKTLAKDGKEFPQQIDVTIGGYLADPELPMKQAVMQSIKNKMFLNADAGQQIKEPGHRQLLEDLCRAIESNDGWENKICVHTDKWTNEDLTQATMCFLTAIKHISCSQSDLAKIENTLGMVMQHQKEQGTAARTLTAYTFVPLDPVIENSCANYYEDEITKARKAHEKSGGAITVTFNDLAVATLAKNSAFQTAQYAHLTVSGYDSIDPDVSKSLELLGKQPRELSGGFKATEAIPPNNGTAASYISPFLIVLEKFEAARETIIAVTNSFSNEKEKQLAVGQFIESCHELMLEGIISTERLDASREILIGGEKVLQQIDEMYFALEGRVGQRLGNFPPELAQRWNELDNH